MLRICAFLCYSLKSARLSAAFSESGCCLEWLHSAPWGREPDRGCHGNIGPAATRSSDVCESAHASNRAERGPGLIWSFHLCPKPLPPQQCGDGQTADMQKRFSEMMLWWIYWADNVLSYQTDTHFYLNINTEWLGGQCWGVHDSGRFCCHVLIVISRLIWCENVSTKNLWKEEWDTWIYCLKINKMIHLNLYKDPKKKSIDFYVWKTAVKTFSNKLYKIVLKDL